MLLKQLVECILYVVSRSRPFTIADCHTTTRSCRNNRSLLYCPSHNSTHGISELRAFSPFRRLPRYLSPQRRAQNGIKSLAMDSHKPKRHARCKVACCSFLPQTWAFTPLYLGLPISQSAPTILSSLICPRLGPAYD